MAVFEGADFVLMAETAVPGTYVNVADMDNFDDGTDAPVQEFPVFGGTKYLIPGARAITFTASGFYNPTDAGQALLLAAEKDRDNIKIKVMYDGTNGYTIEVKVQSRKFNAKAEGLQTIAFDMLAQAASVVVGTGPAI